MQVMNAAKVKAIFEREAVLLGAEDRVPEFRAAILFGKAAVEHVNSMNARRPGYYVSGYGVGDYTMFALTFYGFQAAASFCNVQQLREEAEGQE